MLNNLFKSKYHVVFIAVLILSILVPFIAIPNFHLYKYIASGDFISPISLDSIYYANFFGFKPFAYGGTNSGYLIAKLFPEITLYTILGFLNISPSFATLLYISIIILLSEISMYYFLVYVFTSKLIIKTDRKYFFSILGSIIYTFSPYFISAIPPGHFTQLTVYAVFPLLLALFDKNVHEEKLGVGVFIKYCLIFFFCSTALGNIAFIYVILLTLSLYSLLIIIIEKISLIKVFRKLFLLILALVISNIYWILPFANTAKQLINLSTNTLMDLNNQVYLAVTKVNLLTIFYGKVEWQLYLLESKYYINNISLSIFIAISIFFMIAILKSYKNKFIIILLAMLLFAIFISKGPRQPFGDLFMWFYNNILGFQVFRRPTSKYYGVFLMFYYTLALIGVALISIKLSAKKFISLVIIPTIIIVVYLIFIFIKTFQLTSFNIPSYYLEAKDYLIKENVRKLLILPGLNGQQPTYNKSINNLYAIDFLFFIWNFPFDSPNNASFATFYQKDIINPVIKAIIDKQDACTLLQKAGISHIMVRQDLKGIFMENTPKDLINILNKNELVDHKKIFSNSKNIGFTIYTLNNKCLSNFIQLSGNNFFTIDYQIINPTKIKISVKNLKDTVVLSLLNNYDSDWKLYLVNYSNKFFIKNESLNINTYPKKKIFFEGDELKLLSKTPLLKQSNKINKDNYTNRWTISPQMIRKNYPSSYYELNPDGSFNLHFVLFFTSQGYLYLGFVMFGIIFTLIFIFLVRYFYIKAKKRFS